MAGSRDGAKGKEAALELSGELTVREARRLQALLGQGLGRRDRIEVDLSGATEVDIAGLQLMCAAHKSAAERGKQIVLRGVPECIGLTAKAAGFRRLDACVACPEEACLWA